MHHCAGGPGPNTFDMLTALENRVERGVAPQRVIATKFVNNVPTQGVERTRPLCPHPQTAQYVGKGSIDDAANFVCRDSKNKKGEHHGHDDHHGHHDD
jgi:feruloyl esterase